MEVDDSKDRKCDIEMGFLFLKKLLEFLFVVEVKSFINKEVCVKVLFVIEII